ncbi:MAG TPA: tripartite tricarboxylate transporter TctB family protein [Usitatibacteraceae bacterium]
MIDAFRKGDFWAGLALAALGAYIVKESLGWVYLGEDGPGAGFFPRWYGITMVFFSLLMVAGAVLKRDPASARSTLNWSELRRALGCWLALVICVALLKVLGFFIAFSLLGWFMIAIMFRQPQRIALSVSIGGALGFYLLFSWGLDLSLPSGMLF